MDRWYLLLPMVSAFLYTIAALSQKNAIAAGVGPWRMSALTCWSISGAFLPFAFLADDPGLPDPLWPAVLCGTLFFVGQVLTVLAITRGDVSVATPVLASKVVLVVFFLALFTTESMTLTTWTAALLTTVGIFFLQWEPRREKRVGVWFTVVVAFLSACCFAGADVLVQEGSNEQGFFVFISTSFGTTFLLGFLLIPLFRAPVWRLPRGSGVHLTIGTVLIAIQAVGLAFAIGYFSDAAGANIVYSSRGLWSVVLVWTIGHWFQNVEKEAGNAVLLLRLIGAALIVSAIVLVFL